MYSIASKLVVLGVQCALQSCTASTKFWVDYGRTRVAQCVMRANLCMSSHAQNARCRWLCSLTGLGLVENKCFGHSEQLSAPLSVLVALRYSWAVFFLPAQPFTHVLYTAWAAWVACGAQGLGWTPSCNPCSVWVLARNGYREAVLTDISPPKERCRAQPSAPSQYMQVLSWQPAKCHWQARIKQN